MLDIYISSFGGEGTNEDQACLHEIPNPNKKKQIMRYIYLGVRSIEHCNVLSEKIISQPTVPAESPFSEQIIYKLMYR